MKCKECKNARFEEYNGSPNRYSCEHSDISGYKMICRTKRGSTTITIKTAPKWCPINNREWGKVSGKYIISNEPSLIQIGYWKEIEQAYDNAIVKTKERIEDLEVAQKPWSGSNDIEGMRIYDHYEYLIDENERFLKLLEGEEK